MKKFGKEKVWKGKSLERKKFGKRNIVEALADTIWLPDSI